VIALAVLTNEVKILTNLKAADVMAAMCRGYQRRKTAIESENQGGTTMQEQVRDQRESSIRRESDPFMTTEPGNYEAPPQASTEPQQGDTRELREGNEKRTEMFAENETVDFRSRWQGIQTDFIDDPRRCVERADELVEETMKRLAQIFTEERARLEHSWDQGDDVSTEDLRLAFQRYRSFFDRLLSV